MIFAKNSGIGQPTIECWFLKLWYGSECGKRGKCLAETRSSLAHIIFVVMTHDNVDVHKYDRLDFSSLS